MVDLSQLQPCIVSILRQSDLGQITAKAVRTTLIQDPNFSRFIPAGADLLGRDKPQLSEMIKDCFTVIKSEDDARHARHAPNNGGITLPGLGGVPGGYSQPSQSYPASAPASSAASGSTKSKKRKSDVNDEIESDEEVGSGKKKKKTAAKKAKGGEKQKRAPNPNNPFNAPLILDAALQEICGVPELSRPQITKKIWDYIKGNKLQDPSNGRKVLCDDTLRRFFEQDSVDSFEIAKHVSKHVTKKPKEDAPAPESAANGL